jgi:hypothetical protein
MAKQTINVGTGPNTGTGEAVRTAFIKVNDNFTEVYGIAQGAYDYANTIVSDTQVDPVARSTANAAFDAANDASSLAQNAFDAANNAGGGSANTGDITFEGVKIIGDGDASGDGNGYATLELVPDNSLYENDQYLVIDPTEGEPPHIHIRAGGTQDDSAAVLILGGERNNVRVYDGTGVKLSNDDFSSEDYYFYDYNPDFVSATWSDDEGNYFVDIRTTDPSNPGPTNPDWNKFYSLLQFPENRVTVYDGNEYYELSVIQTYTLGNPYDLRIQVNQAPPTNPSTLEIIQFKIYTLTQNYLRLEEKYLDIEVQDDVSVYAGDNIRLTTGTGSVEITTDDDNSSFSWRFTIDGELELPANGKITEGVVTDNPTIELTPADPEVESQKLVIKGGAADDYHLHLTSGDLTETSLILGTDEHNVRTNVDGNIEINTYSYIDEETKNWLFDRLGNLTAPGDISLENGATVYKAERTDVIGAVPMGDISAVYDDDRGYEILVVKGNDELQLTTNGGDTLKFGNAGLTFPDGTTQTTSWAGGRVVAVPSTSVGVEGDKSGDLAFSNEYFYYCTADYTNGQANIWKRVAWSNDTWGE